jgi:3-oxoacyl-[acyl-carrier protein] reductase
LGDPDDIGPAALFLASDASRWITGQTLVIDGGATIVQPSGRE